MSEKMDSLNGLDETVEENIGADWENEIVRRTEELDSGKVETVLGPVSIIGSPQKCLMVIT